MGNITDLPPICFAKKLFVTLERNLDGLASSIKVVDQDDKIEKGQLQERVTEVTYNNGLRSVYTEVRFQDNNCSAMYTKTLRLSYPVQLGNENYVVRAERDIPDLWNAHCSDNEVTVLNVEAFNPYVFTYTLLKDNEVVAEARVKASACQGSCAQERFLESAADEVSARLLEAALRSISGLPVHVITDNIEIKK